MRIGSLFGIPFYIDPSWLIILTLVTIANANDFNQSGLSGSNLLLGWITGLMMSLLLFASVLLHELGHSLVAKSQGIQVNSITLFLFGGVAAFDKDSATPSQALQVAIAGPVVSFILCGIFFAFTQLLSLDSLTGNLTLELARINLVLGLFNLIPGLPLDGGQVLKAVVWKITGDRFKGMRYAAVSGKLLGWFGITIGLFLMFVTGELSSLWLSLIGWFVLRNATVYAQISLIQETLVTLSAQEVMVRKFKVLNGHLSLREFAEEYILSDQRFPLPYFVASEGRYRGLLKINDLQFIERSEWEDLTLNDIVHPLEQIPSVTENTPLFQVILKLEEIKEPYLTVLSPAGAVSGTIDRSDIVKVIAQKQNLFIPDSEIQRIKQENTYPQGLNLDLIAKMIQSVDN